MITLIYKVSITIPPALSEWLLNPTDDKFDTRMTNIMLAPKSFQVSGNYHSDEWALYANLDDAIDTNAKLHDLIAEYETKAGLR